VDLGTGGLEDRFAPVVRVHQQESAETLLGQASDRVGDHGQHRRRLDGDGARERGVHLRDAVRDGRRHQRVALLPQLVGELLRDDQVGAQGPGRTVLLRASDGDDDVAPPLE